MVPLILLKTGYETISAPIFPFHFIKKFFANHNCAVSISKKKC